MRTRDLERAGMTPEQARREAPTAPRQRRRAARPDPGSRCLGASRERAAGRALRRAAVVACAVVHRRRGVDARDRHRRQHRDVRRRVRRADPPAAVRGRRATALSFPGQFTRRPDPRYAARLRRSPCAAPLDADRSGGRQRLHVHRPRRPGAGDRPVGERRVLRAARRHAGVGTDIRSAPTKPTPPTMSSS